MSEKKFTELSDEELLKAAKKEKSAAIINASLIGLLIGVAVYSAVKNGLGFFTFFPLFFVYMLYRNKNNSKALENEIKSRNLK